MTRWTWKSTSSLEVAPRRLPLSPRGVDLISPAAVVPAPCPSRIAEGEAAGCGGRGNQLFTPAALFGAEARRPRPP